MIFLQLTGLSGAGKTSISKAVQYRLEELGYKTKVIDGDEYRKDLCKDLGFSKADRLENVRRLSTVAFQFCKTHDVVLLAAISPYLSMRQDIKNTASYVKTVWINCNLQTLKSRDTKGLYSKAALPESHPDKITNLTGVNDPYEVPVDADLIVHTHLEALPVSVERVLQFVLKYIV